MYFKNAKKTLNTSIINIESTPKNAIHYENFIQYLKQGLLPYVQNNYRIADYNILVGPQAGAGFGLYALMKHTALFDAFILENPYFNPPNINEYLLTESKSFFNPDASLRGLLIIPSHQDFQSFS